MTSFVAFVGVAKERRDLVQTIWRTLAYAARYGMQPLDVLLDMTLADLNSFIRQVNEIVRGENATSGGRDG